MYSWVCKEVISNHVELQAESNMLKSSFPCVQPQIKHIHETMSIWEFLQRVQMMTLFESSRRHCDLYICITHWDANREAICIMTSLLKYYQFCKMMICCKHCCCVPFDYNFASIYIKVNEIYH